MLRNLLNGFWAGVIATGPMTISFFSLFRKMPVREQGVLPASELTDSILLKSPAGELSPIPHAHMTMLSHFGYGGATGALYGVTLAHAPLPRFIKGALYGTAIWSLSYQGIIPALGLHPKAKEMSPRKNAMMIFSHLVWGAALAYSEERLRLQGQQMLGRPRA